MCSDFAAWAQEEFGDHSVVGNCTLFRGDNNVTFSLQTTLVTCYRVATDSIWLPARSPVNQVQIRNIKVAVVAKQVSFIVHMDEFCAAPDNNDAHKIAVCVAGDKWSRRITWRYELSCQVAVVIVFLNWNWTISPQNAAAYLEISFDDGRDKNNYYIATTSLS